MMHLRNYIIGLLRHQGFRRYAGNTAWMFAEQILRMATGLLVGIWVARYLGPAQYGVFSYVIAFTAIFSGIAKLGLDGIIVRDLVKAPDKRDIYLGTAFWLKVTGAVVSFGFVALATMFTSNDFVTKIYIFIIATGMIFQSFEVIDFYFQSKVLSKFVSICKMTQLLFSTILKIYFVLTGAGLFWFVLVSLFDQVTLSVSLLLAYRYQKIGYFFRSFNFSVGKKLLNDSWPLVLSSLMIMIYMRIDQIMLKEMLGAREVGLYSAALKLSEIWYFIPMIITNSLFPAIVASKKINDELFYKRLQQLLNLMFIMAALIAVVMTFSSNFLIIFLYGESFKEASAVLSIHIWGGLFVFSGVVCGQWFLVENLQKISLYRTIIGAIINIVLNIIFIPKFGIIGSAIATLISQSFASLFFNAFNKKTRKLFTMQLKAFFCTYIFKM